jgi:dTDP-4-dehydrorhamnose 3,5-epimerase-like enzyme
MQLASLSIPDVKLLTTDRYFDDRGFFCECYNKRALHAVGSALPEPELRHHPGYPKAFILLRLRRPTSVRQH